MNKLTQKANELESLAVDFIAIFAPWLAPIPSAYLVGRASIAYLLWHWLVALVAAVAVESIGVVSVVNALRLWDYNQVRAKTLDPKAPFPFALALVIFYLVVTIGLTVFLDVIPELARYAPAIFPLLALVGAANIAVKNGQRRREATRAQRLNAPKRATRAQRLNATLQRNPAQHATANQQAMAEVWQPGIGPSELARMVGVNKSTASRWISQQTAVTGNGRINHEHL